MIRSEELTAAFLDETIVSHVPQIGNLFRTHSESGVAATKTSSEGTILNPTKRARRGRFSE